MRDAWDEMCGVLEEYRGRGVRGVMHSFCGTREHYRRILGCGDFLFGVGGVVTFKRSAIAGLLPEIGIERAVLDAPYLTPVPFRGKRNESAYVRYVCAKVAELCGTDERRVEEATERNVRAMFGDSIFREFCRRTARVRFGGGIITVRYGRDIQGFDSADLHGRNDRHENQSRDGGPFSVRFQRHVRGVSLSEDAERRYQRASFQADRLVERDPRAVDRARSADPRQLCVVPRLRRAARNRDHGRFSPRRSAS